MEHTPNGWTKKRYAQCCKELEQVIDIQNKKLQAYKDKEDRLRYLITHCSHQENPYAKMIHYRDTQFGKDLLQILNDKEME